MRFASHLPGENARARRSGPCTQPPKRLGGYGLRLGDASGKRDSGTYATYSFSRRGASCDGGGGGALAFGAGRPRTSPEPGQRGLRPAPPPNAWRRRAAACRSSRDLARLVISLPFGLSPESHAACPREPRIARRRGRGVSRTCLSPRTSGHVPTRDSEGHQLLRSPVLIVAHMLAEDLDDLGNRRSGSVTNSLASSAVGCAPAIAGQVVCSPSQ